VEWSWPAWLISVAAIVISGAIAWREDNWSARSDLGMGFVNHGGMWSDCLLLSMANAVIVPHLTWGPWIALAAIAAAVASVWVHVHWYVPQSATDPPPAGIEADAPARPSHAGSRERCPPGSAHPSSVEFDESPSPLTDGLDGGVEETRPRSGDHMWPTRARGSWWRDLSWAGWAHVAYVIGELTLLAGFLLHPVPGDVVLLVAAIFTIHVPIGLLQPRWYLTGHIATVGEQPLVAPLLLALWAAMLVKLNQ
jgi:hypothetical protein